MFAHNNKKTPHTSINAQKLIEIISKNKSPLATDSIYRLKHRKNTSLCPTNTYITNKSLVFQGLSKTKQKDYSTLPPN